LHRFPRIISAPLTGTGIVAAFAVSIADVNGLRRGDQLMIQG